MSYSREGRSVSPRNSGSPGRGRRSRSLSRSRRSRSRSNDSGGASNPGNNLYVTGLSTRVTSSDLEKYFSGEGKVLECHLVTDPRTRESRGFAFVTMETIEDVMATDGPAATHLADGMTEIEILIQGIEREDHALHIIDGEMIIMIHIRDAGIALCQLTVATTDRARCLVASINPFCPSSTHCDNHPAPSFLVCMQLHVLLYTFYGNLFSISDA
ncbi:serine/arginine-rich splicing factor SR45a [Salix suchowensis]|nr:serine/arginine-rich splicing factor SR45a [Salix suchowensis]